MPLGGAREQRGGKRLWRGEKGEWAAEGENYIRNTYVSLFILPGISLVSHLVCGATVSKFIGNDDRIHSVWASGVCLLVIILCCFLTAYPSFIICCFIIVPILFLFLFSIYSFRPLLPFCVSIVLFSKHTYSVLSLLFYLCLNIAHWKFSRLASATMQTHCRQNTLFIPHSQKNQHFLLQIQFTFFYNALSDDVTQ